MTLNRAGIALVPNETRCDANLLPVRSARGRRECVCNGSGILPTDELAAIRLVVRPERLPAGVRDPHAGNIDRAAAGDNPFVLRGREPCLHQLN
jgi:ABC-type tungstate transport system permease subunit